jgi:hypothetical protein
MQKESNRNAPSRLRFRLSPFTLFRRICGHPPVENLFETCTKGELERRPPPIDLVLPPGSDLPNGETAKVVAYNDTELGFARVTVDINENTLTGEFFTAFRSGATPQVVPGLADSFVLDLKKHKLHK